MKVWIVETAVPYDNSYEDGESWECESVHATPEGAEAKLAEWRKRGREWHEPNRRVRGPLEVET